MVVIMEKPGSEKSVSLVPRQFSKDLPGCTAILSGNTEGRMEELQELLMSRKKRDQLSEEFYINETQDCAVFTQNRGYLTAPLSAEEEAFPIAFSMVIHQQIEMFERLLRAIYAPQNVYCVHVDQKSPPEFQNAVRAIVSCFPNVFIARKLVKVVYASWLRVQADLNCMEDLLEWPVQWKYLLNTCGTDFPIKTNLEMVRALKGLNGKNSMETEHTNDYKKNRWRYHYNVTDHVIRTGHEKSPPPISTPMFMGNAYFVATRDFVAHVLHDAETQQLIEWEKDTYSPDEHLWATLQRMPSVPGSMPPNEKYDQSDMWAIARVVKWSYHTGDIWKGATYNPCTGTYRRAVCVYGAGDVSWLLKQHHLFANKFDPDVDNIAIRCLETVLRFKALGFDPEL